MLTKKPKDMTLEEINAELEFSGIERQFKRLDHAKTFIEKAIDDGRVVAEWKQGKAKPAKKPKERKTPVELKWEDTPYKGRTVFCPSGKAEILKYNTEFKRFQVKVLSTGIVKHHLETACRFKAVNDKYRENYVHDKEIKTESGSISVHNGDDVAGALIGLHEQAIIDVARENGLEAQMDAWIKNDLKQGLRRMSLGNMLRTKIRRGEKVRILGETVTKAIESRVKEAKRAKKAKD